MLKRVKSLHTEWFPNIPEITKISQEGQLRILTHYVRAASAVHAVEAVPRLREVANEPRVEHVGRGAGARFEL